MLPLRIQKVVGRMCIISQSILIVTFINSWGRAKNENGIRNPTATLSQT